jgi:hypothetical protein
MATRISTTVYSHISPSALIIEWAAISGGDGGSWQLLGHYNDKCVHVYGTFSGGATITLQGSNQDSTPSSGFSLTDPTQTIISFIAEGGRQVLENPLYIRPVLTAGDGSTALTVRLVCRI